MDQARGLDPVIEAYKRDVDRTLIRKNLKLSYEERLQNAMQLQKFADELQRAGGRKPHRAGGGQTQGSRSDFRTRSDS